MGSSAAEVQKENADLLSKDAVTRMSIISSTYASSPSSDSPVRNLNRIRPDQAVPGRGGQVNACNVEQVPKIPSSALVPVLSSARR